MKIRHSLQRELEQCTNEYAMMQGGTNSLIDHLKEQVEKISLSKVIVLIRCVMERACR